MTTSSGDTSNRAAHTDQPAEGDPDEVDEALRNQGSPPPSDPETESASDADAGDI
ncbi:MAG TPA: hypothetical protein VKA65_16645 [Acidimicrobiales bacterium]|jgi:hypothetical protein|nr:hypothetical protein [Acidimicrobiales bacterium]